ncbi:hypothetical protein GCM10009865_10880 [Aeromicrobium ponti]|uniref:HlyD family secretion protein n=1 Tax=Cytobacillus oceanisediminis TaxID=665099 RepID=A0A562K2Y9_9BACI|nr:efflux RND transporter periplasmic adaptor subunit [Cytobacillus oceanisediminis]TWH89716.1 HlyD family secretion protein [Cytobacillus oceanisediminis]
MKKWTLAVLGASVIALIACNFFLILKDDSKIARSAYVDRWQAIGKGDLKESLKTEGVVTSSEEHYVYFDEDIGSFNQFLVKEGDTVNPGDALFEYDSFNIEADKRNMEANLDKVEDQIDSLEDHIDELRSFISVIESKGTYNNTNDLDNSNHSESMNLVYNSVVDVEREIYNKELEKELLEKEADLLEKQIDNMDEQSSRLKVSSNVEGMVTKVNADLNNPVIVIKSSIPAVKGLLDEKELTIVETGMPALIYPTVINERLKGFVSKVLSYPEEEPSLEEESVYPFYIELEGDNKDLHPGAHTGLTIITNEIKDAVIIPANTAKKQKDNTYVYVITESGKLVKQKVKPGITVNKKQQIKEGLEGNEILAIFPSYPRQFAETDFITPIKTKNFSKKSFKSLTRKEVLKYTLTGFIRR